MNGFVAACLLLGAAAAARAGDRIAVDQLRQLTLEELLNVEVTTASKKEQRLSDTAAAVSVLNGDDIRRLGVSTIPEALRGLPGVDVARLNSHRWGVSVRGFNDIFANKLLVMVDGRSVYTPLFSGTLWDIHDLPLEDIERIEVVRGPGASVWGANAVNGVINIITLPAHQTEGGRMDVGGGTLDEFAGSLRYGIPVSDSTSVRVFGKYRQHAEMEDVSGGPAEDDYRAGTAGFRLDWDPSDTADFMLSGRGFSGEYSEKVDLLSLPGPGYLTTVTSPNSSGGHALGRWGRRIDETSRVELQSYVEFNTFDVDWLEEERLNFDVALTHRWQPTESHDLNWGVGYRLTTDRITESADTASYPRRERTDRLFSGFVQDDYAAIPDVLTLTAGVRFEDNDYTGFEIQPTLRALWRPAEEHSLWLAGSRAVRTPSRSESDASINIDYLPPGTVHPVLPGVVVYSGTTEFKSEELWAFEAGYRWQPLPSLNVDATGFFNLYEMLRGSRPGTPFPNDPLAPSYVVVPVTAVNDTAGNTWGGELAAVWQATDIWQWRLSYSYIGFDLRGSDAAATSGYSPRHKVSLLSRLDLPGNLEFDSQLRFVDELTAPAIPSYVTLDLRLGWHPLEDLEISISGYNLLGGGHQEFASRLIRYIPSEITPSVFGKVSWRF